MVKNINLEELTDTESLRQLLKEIKKGVDQYIVQDNGQPQAALLSLDDLELLKKTKESKEKGWDRLFENLEKVHARNPDVSEEEVQADVDAAIREIRRQRA